MVIVSKSEIAFDVQHGDHRIAVGREGGVHADARATTGSDGSQLACGAYCRPDSLSFLKEFRLEIPVFHATFKTVKG